MTIVSASTGWILGWTLIHSLWQGALVAGALALALRFVPGSMVRLRGVISWSALALVLALAAATWMLVDTEWRSHSACWESAEFAREHAVLCVSHAVPVASAELEASVGENWKTSIARPESWVERMALPVPASVRTVTRSATGGVAMLAGAAALLAWVALFRLVLGLGLLRGILGRSRPVGRSDLSLRLHRLASELGVVGPVELRETDDISTPAVAGWRRPVILVPRDLPAVLTSEQLEDVLAHELVHVRGRHFAVNLGQRVVDCLCVFNPFALWISSRIREEREAQCDRTAAGPPSRRRRRYVETLLQLEGLREPTSPALVGVLGEGSLLRRVRRLVDVSPPRGRAGVVGSLLAGGVALATVAIVVQVSLTMVSLTAWSVMSHDIARRDALEAPSHVESAVPASPEEPAATPR